MKIAVTASGPTLDDQVDPRFGRCPYFLVVETETMEFDALENPSIALGGGAGIQSGQLMADRDVKAVLTGNCGPNAFQTLGAADIQVIVGVNGTVREAVEKFKTGAFSGASDPNVASHFGMGAGGAATAAGSTQLPAQQTQMGGGIQMGKGMGGGGGTGRGMGGGGGRGMGGGMGRGMGRGIRSAGSGQVGMGAGMGGVAPPPQMTGGSELDSLKAQAQALEEQLKAMNTQISQAEQRAALPGLVAVVDSEKCNLCGVCAEVCPTSAILVGDEALIDVVKCTGCARCVAECPQNAISLHKAA